MAQLMHNKARVSGTFSNRARWSTTNTARNRTATRHLEHGIASQETCVVAVFVARRDHQEPKTNDVGEAVCDLIRRTRIFYAGASRSSTRRRCSTSRKARTPPSDESRPPSNLVTIVLPETGDDKPCSGSIESIMAGGASRKRRGLESTTKSYAKSVSCATSANLCCIMRVKSSAFRPDHRGCHPPRCLPKRCRSGNRYRKLLGASQCRTQTFRLDRCGAADL